MVFRTPVAEAVHSLVAAAGNLLAVGHTALVEVRRTALVGGHHTDLEVGCCIDPVAEHRIGQGVDRRKID